MDPQTFMKEESIEAVNQRLMHSSTSLFELTPIYPTYSDILTAYHIGPSI